MKYTAVHGDTWDSIAYKTYGDEFLCDEICKSNAREYEDVVMFDGGEVVEVPETLSPKTEIIKAPWG